MVDTINPIPNQSDGQPSRDSQPFYSGFSRPGEIKVNLAREQEGIPVSEKAEPAEVKKKPTNEVDKPESIQPEQKPVTEGFRPESAKPELEPVEKEEKPKLAVEQNPPEPQPVQEKPKVADLQSKPQPKYQTTYASQKPKEPIVWRRILAVLGGGIALTAIAGLITFFVADAINKSRIEKQRTELSDLNEELDNLTKTPALLELPKVEPPKSSAPASESPKVEPSGNEQTTPSQTAPTTPTVQPSGGQEAQG
jgi:hypothetical protein